VALVLVSFAIRAAKGAVVEGAGEIAVFVVAAVNLVVLLCFVRLAEARDRKWTVASCAAESTPT